MLPSFGYMHLHWPKPQVVDVIPNAKRESQRSDLGGVIPRREFTQPKVRAFIDYLA